MYDAQFFHAGPVEPFEGSDPQVDVRIDRVLHQDRNIGVLQGVRYLLHEEGVRGGPGAYPYHVDAVFYALEDMLLACDFGAYLHPEFFFHLAEPFETLRSDSFEGSRMGAGLPYPRPVHVYAEFVQPLGSHHDLQLGFCAAGACYDEGRNAFVEESPLRNGDDVKISIHIILLFSLSCWPRG